VAVYMLIFKFSRVSVSFYFATVRSLIITHLLGALV